MEGYSVSSSLAVINSWHHTTKKVLKWLLLCSRRNVDPMHPSAPNIADFFSTVTGSVMLKIRTAITWTVLDSHKQFFFNRAVNAMIHGDGKAHPML